MSVYPEEDFAVRRWLKEQAHRPNKTEVGELTFRAGIPPTVNEFCILSVHSYRSAESTDDTSATVITTGGPSHRYRFCTHRLTRAAEPMRWVLSERRDFATLALAVGDIASRNDDQIMEASMT